MVNNKVEYREVIVEEVIDYDKDEYTRTRTDTGELLQNRKLTDEEKQLVMFDDDEVPQEEENATA